MEKSLGKLVTEMRKAKGYTQFEVCVATGLKMTLYTHLERQPAEEDGSVKLGTLRKLAAFYGIPVSEMLKAIE